MASQSTEVTDILYSVDVVLFPIAIYYCLKDFVAKRSSRRNMKDDSLKCLLNLCDVSDPKHMTIAYLK